MERDPLPHTQARPGRAFRPPYHPREYQEDGQDTGSILRTMTALSLHGWRVSGNTYRLSPCSPFVGPGGILPPSRERHCRLLLMWSPIHSLVRWDWASVAFRIRWARFASCR